MAIEGGSVEKIFSLNQWRLEGIIRTVNSFNKPSSGLCTYLCEDGIAIEGGLKAGRAYVPVLLGMLVHGSKLNREDDNLYLQIFKYDRLPSFKPEVDLEELLRVYIDGKLWQNDILPYKDTSLFA